MNGGEKIADRLFLAKRVLLQSPVPLVHKASLWTYGYLYMGAPSPAVSPRGSHTRTGTLPYATSFQYFHSSVLELVTSPGRAQVSQSRHQRFFKSSVLSQKAKRILHNNHIRNIYFNTEKYPPHPQNLQLKPSVFWNLLLTLT